MTFNIIKMREWVTSNPLCVSAFLLKKRKNYLKPLVYQVRAKKLRAFGQFVRPMPAFRLSSYKKKPFGFVGQSRKFKLRALSKPIKPIKFYRLSSFKKKTFGIQLLLYYRYCCKLMAYYLLKAMLLIMTLYESSKLFIQKNGAYFCTMCTCYKPALKRSMLIITFCILISLSIAKPSLAVTEHPKKICWHEDWHQTATASRNLAIQNAQTHSGLTGPIPVIAINPNGAGPSGSGPNTEIAIHPNDSLGASISKKSTLRPKIKKIKTSLANKLTKMGFPVYGTDVFLNSVIQGGASSQQLQDFDENLNKVPTQYWPAKEYRKKNPEINWTSPNGVPRVLIPLLQTMGYPLEHAAERAQLITEYDILKRRDLWLAATPPTAMEKCIEIERKVKILKKMAYSPAQLAAVDAALNFKDVAEEERLDDNNMSLSATSFQAQVAQYLDAAEAEPITEKITLKTIVPRKLHKPRKWFNQVEENTPLTFSMTSMRALMTPEFNDSLEHIDLNTYERGGFSSHQFAFPVWQQTKKIEVSLKIDLLYLLNTGLIHLKPKLDIDTVIQEHHDLGAQRHAVLHGEQIRADVPAHPSLALSLQRAGIKKKQANIMSNQLAQHWLSTTATETVGTLVNSLINKDRRFAKYYSQGLYVYLRRLSPELYHEKGALLSNHLLEGPNAWKPVGKIKPSNVTQYEVVHYEPTKDEPETPRYWEAREKAKLEQMWENLLTERARMVGHSNADVIHELLCVTPVTWDDTKTARADYMQAHRDNFFRYKEKKAIENSNMLYRSGYINRPVPLSHPLWDVSLEESQ